MSEKNKPQLIIDCDGVLYKADNEIKFDVYGKIKDISLIFGISNSEFEEKSNFVKENKKLGLFNFVNCLVDYNREKLIDFLSYLFPEENYMNLPQDFPLLEKLKETSKYFDIVIFSNNTMKNVRRVLLSVFNLSIEEFPFKCYDSLSTEVNGIFYPKNYENSFKYFCEKIGKKPEECILIDDDQRNILSANSQGVKTILITKEYNLSQCLDFLLKNK